MNTTPGMNLDPRAQATMNALAGVVLDPKIHRTNCIVGIGICSVFISIFFLIGLGATVIGFLGGGWVAGLVGLSFFLFPGIFAGIPIFIVFRLLRIMKALPK